MTHYQCFENNHPCQFYNIKNWHVDTFPTKREAEIFCYLWAYPITKEEAEKLAPEMELNKKYNYSTCEYPVNMEIREVEVS